MMDPAAIIKVCWHSSSLHPISYEATLQDKSEMEPIESLRIDHMIIFGTHNITPSKYKQQGHVYHLYIKPHNIINEMWTSWQYS